MYGYGMDGSGVSQGRAECPKQIAPPLPSSPLSLPLMLYFPISGEISGHHLQQERPKGTSLQQYLNVSDWWHRHRACGEAGRQWVVGGPEESQTLALRPGPPSSLGLEQLSSQVPGKLRQQHLPQWVPDSLKSS